MHLKKVTIFPEKFPTREVYPFNLAIFSETQEITFSSKATFFVGENGTGKSTLLEAITRKCGIYIWGCNGRPRYIKNPYEKDLYKALKVEWTDGSVPGSFFSSKNFQNFSEILDEWAISDPCNLDHFGGQSLMTQSHGQSIMSFFQARYKIKGLYFLDEPETALSPKSQLELLNLITQISKCGHAQFIIATHSPILLSSPGSQIYNFDTTPISLIQYDETEHFQIYKKFFREKNKPINKSI